MKNSAPTPRQLREALSCAWDYSQMVIFVREVQAHTRGAWEWLVPEVHEALIAQKAFAVVRSQHKLAVDVREMDRLLAGMRVIAGLAELEEVVS